MINAPPPLPRYHLFLPPSSTCQNSTGKTCGSWTRLPRRYRRQLRRHELFAQLTGAGGRAVAGRVAKHYGLASELFSGLLLPDGGGGGGGGGGAGASSATAIVSVSGQTGSVHAMLLLGPGLFADLSPGRRGRPDETADVPLRVEFRTEDELTGEVRTVQENIRIPRVDKGEVR